MWPASTSSFSLGSLLAGQLEEFVFWLGEVMVSRTVCVYHCHICHSTIYWSRGIVLWANLNHFFCTSLKKSHTLIYSSLRRLLYGSGLVLFEWIFACCFLACGVWLWFKQIFRFSSLWVAWISSSGS